MPKKVDISMDGATKSVEVAEPPKKKCELRDVLPPKVIPLVKAAPNNETIRNLLLAHLKVPVPASEDTFEKVQHWIEFNIEPPKLNEVKLWPSRPARPEDNVQVLVSATDRERGTCSYAIDVAGRGNIPIRRAHLIDAAANADDEDEFLVNVREIMDENGPQNYISMVEDDETLSVDSKDCHESDGIELEIQPDGIAALKNALRTADPEQYERLFE